MTQQEEDERDANESHKLKAMILLTIAASSANPVNSLAALCGATGTMIAGMTLGLSDQKRKEAIDSAVAVDGPLVKSVRIAAEAEIPNVKKFEAAKAGMGGGAPASRPSSPEQPKKERSWGDLG